MYMPTPASSTMIILYVLVIDVYAKFLNLKKNYLVSLYNRV